MPPSSISYTRVGENMFEAIHPNYECSIPLGTKRAHLTHRRNPFNCKCSLCARAEPCGFPIGPNPTDAPRIKQLHEWRSKRASHCVLLELLKLTRTAPRPQVVSETWTSSVCTIRSSDRQYEMYNLTNRGNRGKVDRALGSVWSPAGYFWITRFAQFIGFHLQVDDKPMCA